MPPRASANCRRERPLRRLLRAVQEASIVASGPLFRDCNGIGSRLNFFQGLEPGRHSQRKHACALRLRQSSGAPLREWLPQPRSTLFALLSL